MATTLVLFQNEQQFLENATTDADILAVLKTKEVPTDDLPNGLIMVQTAKEAFARRQTLVGNQIKATVWIKTELPELRVEMSLLELTARTELKGRPDLLKTLGVKELKHAGGKKAKGADEKSASDKKTENEKESELQHRPKEPEAAESEADKARELSKEEAARKAKEAAKDASEKPQEGGAAAQPISKKERGRHKESRAIVSFVGESESILNAALGSQEILDALAEGSYSRAYIESLSARVEALRKANVAQDEAVGTTQAATVDLRKQIAGFKKWFTPRRARVLRALRKHPELVKRLGQSA